MLHHLDLTCGRKPSFQLETFAKTIRGFPKLRTLKLAIVRYPGNETLASAATRIARTNPRLHKFSLTFIPQVYPIPLPFSISYLPFPFPFSARATGAFDVSYDEHGLPIRLSVVEHSEFIWPWGLGVSSRTRKYWKDLRPPSYPGRRKTGVKGFVNLIFEKSSAGEEMRMILFCVFLVALAACGIVANRTGSRSRVRSEGWCKTPEAVVTTVGWSSVDL